jgi:hypothetical protein
VSSVVLVVALLPYAFFALRDGTMHLGKSRVRSVPLGEHALHILIIAPLAWLIAGVFMRDLRAVSIGAALFLPIGIADEFIFHRKSIPADEIDAHAKSHLALLLFLGVGALLWIEPWH